MFSTKEPHNIFALCLSFYTSNKRNIAGAAESTMFDLIRDSLSDYLLGLSIMHQSVFPGWVADEHHPGYMIRIELPTIMRAPYHLVFAFPSGKTLDGIWKLSREVKTLPDSIICLSGSATLSKAVSLISDLDFCEYVTGRAEDVAEALMAKANAPMPLVFKGLRFCADRWSDCLTEATRAALCRIVPTVPELSHAKIDFLGKAEGLRPSDVSNVMIFCDSSWQSASLSRSFAAQEAHLDPVALVPQDLCHPLEMGRYLYWLHEQASGYLVEDKHVKAIKRCLSLARVAFLSKISDQITSYISQSCEFIQKEIEAVNEMISAIDNTNRSELNPWKEELLLVREDLQDDLARAKRRTNAISLGDFTRTALSSLKSAMSGVSVGAGV